MYTRDAPPPEPHLDGRRVAHRPMQHDAPSGAESAAQSARRGQNPTHFSALPLPLFLRILAYVPVDVRLRCAEVCRAWRDAVADRSLWTRIDISTASGVAKRERYGPLLRAAAARADGQLQALDARCNGYRVQPELYDEVLAVVRANAAALTHLHVPPFRNDDDFDLVARLEALLTAAPQLSELKTGVAAVARRLTHADVRRLLRNEPPFGPLRMSTLRVCYGHGDGEPEAVGLAADVRGHASLKQLLLYEVPLRSAAALDAVVDAALALALTELVLYRCRLHVGSVPSIVRLLGSTALSRLVITGEGPLLDASAAALLSAALRANRVLEQLGLRVMNLWQEPAAGAAVVMALVGHPRLSFLNFCGSSPPVDGRGLVGAALFTLLAANAPALQSLDIGMCSLGDAGMGPVCDALSRNTHLRQLSCADNDVSEAFAAERLLPAVRANASLRWVRLAGHNVNQPRYAALLEAERLVNARADAAGAAAQHAR